MYGPLETVNIDTDDLGANPLMLFKFMNEI